MPRFAVPSYQAQVWLRAVVRSAVSSPGGCSLMVMPGCSRERDSESMMGLGRLSGEDGLRNLEGRKVDVARVDPERGVELPDLLTHVLELFCRVVADGLELLGVSGPLDG